MSPKVLVVPETKRFDTIDICIYDSAPLREAESCMASENIEFRVQSLQDKVVKIATKVATIEGKLYILEKPTNPILIAALAFCGACFLAYGSWLGVRVVSLSEDVKALTTVMLPSALSGASTDPTNPANIELVSRVLATAKEKKIPIQSQTIARVGNRFIEAAKSDPRSWAAAIQLINYRSTLNVAPIPPFPQGRCIVVPPDSTGIVNSIESLTLANCAQELDHIQWKDVAFRDVNVIYHSGPTVLENVHFINCKFHLDFAPPTQVLGQSLLASNSVTIKLPTP